MIIRSNSIIVIRSKAKLDKELESNRDNKL